MTKDRGGHYYSIMITQSIGLIHGLSIGMDLMNLENSFWGLRKSIKNATHFLSVKQ